MAVAHRIGSVGGEGAVNIVALGWGLTATFLALFIVCAVVAMLFPDVSFSHKWLELYSTAPAGSLANLVEGVIWNVVFAWFAAVIFGFVYNRLAH